MSELTTAPKEEQRDARDVFARQLRLLHQNAYQQNPPSPRRGEARKALAGLRRGLIDPQALPAVAVVYTWGLANESVYGYRLTPYLQAASLFGLYTQGRAKLPEFKNEVQGRRQSLGTSAQLLRIELKNGAESLDRRFSALIDSRPDDLFTRLRHLFRLLRSHDVPINFRSLLTDLQHWHSGDPDRLRTVRRAWAEDYWRPLRQTTDQND